MRKGLQFLALIVLARLLTPDDFGVFAMLAVFIGVANIFIDSGFGSALIQRQVTTRIDESTVFFFNLVMGAIVALMLCAAAPWIAIYFNQSLLRYLTYAMALNVFLNAFGSIHTTLLIKDLNFKTIAKVGGMAALLSGAVAVLLASQDYGVWSLVVQTLTASMISLVLLWIWHPWRPVWKFSIASLRTFFKFGGYLMAISLADTLSSNLYSLLIGKYYSVRDVGYYDRAQKTQLLPVNLIMSVVNRVAYPVFSAAANDKEKLARGYRKAQRLIMFVNIPLMLGVIVLAEPIVAVLFGGQWLPSVPILQVLGLVGVMWPLHILNLNVLKAQGRSDLFFKIEIFKKVFVISLTVVASLYGIMAIAWAQVIASTVLFFVNAYYTGVFLSYGAWAQLNDIAPYVASSIPMVLVAWFSLYVMDLPYYIEFALAALLGGLTYYLVVKLFRLPAAEELVNIIQRRYML